MAERVLALHLPAFRLERCGFDPVEVVALIAEQRSAMRLIAVAPGAAEAGLREGMTVSEARSLVPAVRFELLDPDEEARDRGELLRAFEVLSDRVEVWGESGLVAWVTRTARAFGGEPALLGRAVAFAEGLGHRCGVVIADDPRAAMALASRDEVREIVPPGGLAGAVSGLSPRALGASDALCGALAAVGIRALGALARLDPASVAGRFGAEGVALHRLARGEAGALGEPAFGGVADELPRVEAALGGATTTLQLHFALTGLLGALCAALAARDLAAVRLRVVLRLERGGPVAVGVRVGRPTREPRALERLVRARLDGLAGQLAAPIDALVLEVAEAAPETGWQPGLTDRAERAEPLPDVLARLLDALGPEAVFAAEPVDVWCPERAWRPVPFALTPPVRRPPPPPTDVVRLQERWEASLRAVRPAELLPRPVPIDVREDERGPVGVRVDDTWSRVDDRRGPELLSGDWWRPERAWERAYWIVALAGGRTAWIFAEQGRWFLQGWY